MSFKYKASLTESSSVFFRLLNLEYQLFCFPLSCYYKLNNYRFK